MAATPRPRRSALYMPGANTRALEKSRGLPADVLILDLEDAVAPDAKAQARANIAAALGQGGYGRGEMVMRVNGLATPWGHADLAAAAAMPLDAVLLPKVESADAVRQAEAVLAAAGAPAAMAVWCMMETPLGMLHAEEIAAASPRVACLVMGTSDLAKDLHARHTRDRLPMLTSLGLCLLAARAYRLAILDGVHLDLADDPGFAAVLRARPRAGIRRQDADPPQDAGGRQRRLRARGGRGGVVAPHHRRPCRGGGLGQGHRAGRRQAHRESPCRGRAADGDAGRADRGDGGSVSGR